MNRYATGDDRKPSLVEERGCVFKVLAFLYMRSNRSGKARVTPLCSGPQAPWQGRGDLGTCHGLWQLSLCL